MAQLSKAGRSQVKKFALPDKERFPINDLEHGRKALQMAPRALSAGSITKAEHDKIIRAVYREYPQLKKNADMNDRIRRKSGR